MFVLADLILRRLRVAGACMEVRRRSRRIGGMSRVRVHAVVVAAGSWRVAGGPIGSVARCRNCRMMRIGLGRVAIGGRCGRRRRQTSILMIAHGVVICGLVVRMKVAVVFVGVGR